MNCELLGSQTMELALHEVALARPGVREIAVPVDWPIVAAPRAALATVGPSLLAFEEQEERRRQSEAAERQRAEERARTVVRGD